MSQKSPLPHPEKVQQTVTKMRDVCRQFDHLNLVLDELISQIDLDIRNSPLTAYRLGKKLPIKKSIGCSSFEVKIYNEITKFLEDTPIL